VPVFPGRTHRAPRFLLFLKINYDKKTSAMKTKIALIPFLLLLAGCSPVFLWLNGIRKPHPESVESVREKLCSYDPDYAPFLCIPKDSAALYTMMKKIQQIPSNSVYTRQGSRIRFIDTSYCAGVALDFARKLNPDSSYTLYPESSFSELIPCLTPLGNKADLQTGSYDFTIVFFWANFMGRGNHNVFLIARELEKSYPGKINYLFVNVDIQKSWNMKTMPYLPVEVAGKK
jgi:hypothetical protein